MQILPQLRTLVATVIAMLVAFSLTNSAEARTVVSYKGVSKGSIVIDTSQRRLYYGLGNGKALRYRVGVGRRGKQWTGTKRIWSKRRAPAWSPPAQVRRDKPSLPRVIPGGSPRNPMGAAALVLSGGGQYAIHGTNNPRSVGRFVSYGCIRMYNRDIRDLYSRVWIGTKVTVKR